MVSVFCVAVGAAEARPAGAQVAGGAVVSVGGTVCSKCV